MALNGSAYQAHVLVVNDDNEALASFLLSYSRAKDTM
jgi:hypothetical protein